MNEKADVVIVGGGVWGASAAYHLSLIAPGKRIILVERNSTIATETTRQAAGQVGQLRSDPLMIGAVRYTLELLTRFQEETGHDPEFTNPGSLHLAQNKLRMQAFLQQLPNAEKHGINVQVASKEKIHDLAPAINTNAIEGALYVAGDGYVNAEAWANALAAAATDRGVDIRLNTEIASIDIAGGKANGLTTSAAGIDTDRVILAAGPWTRQMAGELSISLPAIPIRLQQTRTAADPNQPAHHPVIRIPDQSCYLRPEKRGYLYGFFDPSPFAYSSPLNSTSDLLPVENLHSESTRRLAPTFPILEQLAVSQHRQGMVTCTPDANYVIGPVPDVEGICFATGCGAMGVAGSGAVGKWLANWAINNDPGEDLSTLSPTRFGSEWNDADSLQTQCRNIFANYYALRSATYRMADER